MPGLFPTDPSNKRVARNVLKYEKLLVENPSGAEAQVVLQRPNVTHLQTRDTYEELCQTLGSQVGSSGLQVGAVRDGEQSRIQEAKG